MSEYTHSRQQQHRPDDAEGKHYATTYGAEFATESTALGAYQANPQDFYPASNEGLDAPYPMANVLSSGYTLSNIPSIDLDPTRIIPEPPLTARRSTPTAQGGSRMYSDASTADALPLNTSVVSQPTVSTPPIRLARPTVGSDRTSQTAHERRHPDSVVKYVCEYCGKDFTKRHNYEGHINSHEGKRPYQCAHCDQGFARQSDCRRHEQEYCPRRRSDPSASA